MLDKAKLIVIEGPIGAGKTLLAQKLSQHLKYSFISDEPSRNPFLERFYLQQDRWALATQLYFLYQRIDLLSQLDLSKQSPLIMNFLLDKDKLFAQIALIPDELKIYQRIHDRSLPSNLPKPDLVIYLQAKPDTLLDRIHQQSTHLDKKVSYLYLENLCRSYAEFFHHYESSPLFILDTDNFDPIFKEEDFNLLLERLHNMRSYREFFSYSQ